MQHEILLPTLLRVNMYVSVRLTYLSKKYFFDEQHLKHLFEERLKSSKHSTHPIVLTTAQKMKFSIKDVFSKCDQIRSFLRFGHIH